MESNQETKITGEMLKKMIEDVLQDYQLIAPYPLDAEPRYTGEEPPEDELEDNETINEDKVVSYKGKTKDRDWVRIALYALNKCDEQERKQVFDAWNVQTYDQFLQAVARYERAKKPK